MRNSHVPIGWERTWRSTRTQLRENLWLADHQAVACKPWGEVTAVVALLETPLPYEVQPKQFVHIEQWDGRPVEDATLRRFLSEMERLERDGEVVLLHCQMGISRTPAFAIFWLLYKLIQEATPEDRVLMQTQIPQLGLKTMWSIFEDEIKVQRPWSQPHYQLKQSMLGFLEHEVLGTVA